MEDTSIINQKHTPRERMDQTSRIRFFAPRADIFEREDAFVVMVEMPGVDRDSVDIDLEKNTLTIVGHVTNEPMSGYRALMTEYREGSYKRVFSLSEAVDVTKIDAAMKDGVLRLVLPKADEVKPRKIHVKAA